MLERCLSRVLSTFVCPRFLALSFMLSIPCAAHAGWEVAWIDKFDGNGVNWQNWTAQTQANYNNEIQCYTDDETSENRNYEVSDGTLKITARKQEINCPGQNGRNRPWTSGRLNSKDKGEFLYGRVEARIRFLELKGGTWPAFWMLENRISEQPIKGDNDNVNWPNPGAGEIDVWEWYGNAGDRYITNFFNTASCGSEQRISYPGGAPDVSNFNTYAIEWDADNIQFFMNDDIVAEHDLSDCPQYEESMFVLLNVAIGGNLGGSLDPNLTTATMEVDYVAHCVASDTNSFDRCNESTPILQDDDSDGVGNAQDLCPNTPVGVPVDANGCELATEPQTSAPEPTIDSAQVIALFSDAYTNIADINYNPDWGQATQVSQVEFDGNNTLKYDNLNYQGTDFGGNNQDVSNMGFLHVDYWTHNTTELAIFLISPGPRETPYTVNLVSQSWQSLAIPLSTFSDVDLANVFQIKVEGNGTVFFDNLFFSEQGVIPADTDGDGVIDDNDACPDTPSGSVVDATGCVVTTNAPPTVSFVVSQGGGNGNIVSVDGGTVTVTASISDADADDTHTLFWRAQGMSGFATNGNDLIFNPSGLTVSEVIITVEVTDNGSPSLTSAGSVTLTIAQESAAQPSTPNPDNSSSGGGSFHIYLLLGLLGLVVRRVYLR